MRAYALSALRRLQAVESRSAQLAVMAQDCDQPDYSKLVQALCSEANVSLITVPASKTLGEWCGLCKLDAEGLARKVVGCSFVVIKVRHRPVIRVSARAAPGIAAPRPPRAEPLRCALGLPPWTCARAHLPRCAPESLPRACAHASRHAAQDYGEESEALGVVQEYLKNK